MPINRLAASLLISLILLAFPFSPVNSHSEIETQKAKEDYSFQFAKFRDAENQFNKSKTAYESFKTAASKTDAYRDTQGYLVQANNMYLSYLSYLEENSHQLEAKKDVPEKSDIEQMLASQKNFFQDNSKKVANAKTLEELLPLAGELHNNVRGAFQNDVYYVLSILDYTKTLNLTADFEKLKSTLDSEIQKLGKENTTIVNNWNAEIAEINAANTAELSRAHNEIIKAKSGRRSLTLATAVERFTATVRSNLSRGSRLFSEILTII